MGSQDVKGHDEHQGSDSPRDRTSTRAGTAGRRQDPSSSRPMTRPSVGACVSPRSGRPRSDHGRRDEPDREPVPYGAIDPNLVSAPVESERPRQGHPTPAQKGSDRCSTAAARGGNRRRMRARRDARGMAARAQAKKDAPIPSRRDDDRDRSGDRREEGRGRPAEKPSFTRTWVLPGLVALVCGVAGAWGYWHFFGSSKSEDQKSAIRRRIPMQDPGGSRRRRDAAKLHQVEAERDDRREGARSGPAAEKAAAALGGTRRRRSWISSRKAVVRGPIGGRFARVGILGRGRGQGQGLTLRQAVDMAESQVADAFDDRPVAEASVREMLGLAYLNLGERRAPSSSTSAPWSCGSPCKGSTIPTRPPAATSSPSPTGSPAARPRPAGCSTATPFHGPRRRADRPRLVAALPRTIPPRPS